MKTKYFSIALSLLLCLGLNSAKDPGVEVAPFAGPIMTLYVVDVGMGDAIFIDIPPKDCMLVDAGSWDSDGIDNLMEFLDEFFSDSAHTPYHNTIDVVLATHQHKDHIQGMLNVLNKYAVRAYIDNGVGCKVAKGKASGLVKMIETLLKKKSIPHAQITELLIDSRGKNGVYSDTLLDPFDNVDVVALAATPKPVASDENGNSIVLKITCNNVAFLLTGDADKKEEERLVQRLQGFGGLAALRVDVVKVGHHGSNTASSAEFLQAVHPKISVVSVGAASTSPMTKSFRLPKQSVMERLEQITSNDLGELWEAQMFPDDRPPGAKKDKPMVFTSTKEIYLTSSDGTIVLSTDGQTIAAGSYEYKNH